MKGLKTFSLLFVWITTLSQAQDWAALKEKMLVEQIEQRGIKSKKVLNSLRKVDRHRFVPLELRNQAYGDFPLPIGAGQTISQPYIVAFMTEVLNLEPTHAVLEIGTGSGYQAAILAELCKEVYTIEIIEALGKKARDTLQALGYQNIFVRIGDGYSGWPEAAPFDAIIVTCSPTDVPQPLQDQLKEGGRMIIPIGESTMGQELVLLTKKNGKLKVQSQMPVRFVPMKDKKGRRY